ncbi:MAG TPA: DUF2723 domain-containing protein [Polyangiales bacterium]|nr:DUF2723 domain-containing protein [Polyangiales bacterium]
MGSLDARRWTPFAAALLPLVIYVWTAAGHGYWLDSAEFTAAAVELDIPHPPGHPLFGLWSQPFCWLPLGPLPFRVAVGQAVAAAIALGFVCRALLHEGAYLALAASWLLAGCYGFWFQAVRAEVYALEAMLVCIAFERVAAWAHERTNTRALYGACFALGLGLANHHFIAVLAMPVLAWPAYDAFRQHGWRALALCTALGASGLVTYAYLPLRALAEPPMDLGDPRTWQDFWWVISAQVYARKIGGGALQPLGERFADLAVILYEQLGLLVLASLLGGYVLLRQRRSWPLAYLWWTAALISLCGRAWLNEVRANPDVLGYMIPGFVALVALAARGVAVFGRARWTAVLPVLALATFWLHRDASLHAFAATDAFDELRRRRLPAASVLILTTPETVFRHWEGEAVEQLRADVTMLPLPFLGYGGSDRVWLRRDPSLRAVVEAYARTGALAPDALRALARERPVFVELDSSTTLSLYPHVSPAGLLYRVDGRHPALATVDARDAESAKQLLWAHYVRTLFFAARGDRARALDAAQHGLGYAPRARELRALTEALSRGAPLDLRSFLVGQK